MSDQEHTAGNDVDVASEEVFPLLEVGQPVDTPLGPGRIHDISLVASDYGSQTELEPSIMVELDDPDEGLPKVIQVCMCKLGLGDEKKEALIRKEFQRLWPPITDEIPKDSRMIVDVQNEFAEAEIQRTIEIQSFRKLNLGAMQEPSVTPEVLEALQLVAYKKYVELSKGSEKIRGRMGDVEEGMILDDEEGSAVVLKTKEGDEGLTKVLLFFPDDEKMKWVSMDTDVEFNGYDGREEVGVQPSVYDPMRMNSPELHLIRVLPDTYLPRDPNYPSSITNTIWRPTIRKTPIRYYNTREGAMEVKPENDPKREKKEDEREWPEDLVNYPTPDFVPHEHHMAPYESGLPVYEYREDKRHPHAPEFIEPTEELVDTAANFWREYTIARQRYNPAFGSHINKSVHQFTKDFMASNDMKKEDALDLLRYMVQVGYFPPSVYDSTVDSFRADDTGMTTRTHYTEDA
jgi:hypothetical protein